MPDPDDPLTETRDPTVPAETPGGPYFGRLLIVLFAAVAFCALITWLLSTLVTA